MEPDLNTEKVATTKKFGSLSETTKICRFCLNASGTDSIINLFGTFAEELNVVGIISQHFWFKVIYFIINLCINKFKIKLDQLKKFPARTKRFML